MTSTTTLPTHEGEFSPQEAQAVMESALGDNLAQRREVREEALKTVQSVLSEWTEYVRPLHKRWRATNFMLSCNTLEKGGFEDIHVPELYKHVETIVPRLEEAVVGREPMFRVIARRRKDADKAEANGAYFDWQFAQAKVRSQIQPAIRSLLVTQVAPFHCYWDNVIEDRWEREIIKSFDKDGRLKRQIKKTKKKKVVFSGPRVDLIDSFDFIIHPKAKNAQDAIYVGHRAWLTMDEIMRLGHEFGWVGVDELRDQKPGSYALEQDYHKWTRDPTMAHGSSMNRADPNDGRPKLMEVVFLYSKWSMDGGRTFKDYRFVAVGGKTILEVRENPNDGGVRPYATMNIQRTGHEFFGVGPLDNAVRMNQHLDVLHQTVIHAAKMTAGPFVFAEDDSDLPDSLYRTRPWQVFKGTGPVKFSQPPEGLLRAAPMLFGDVKNNISETVGSFPIQMGADGNGTATEATLSLQEGNRRQSGPLRAIADGLDQLLQLFHKYSLQYSTEDVEFPVIGKRAISLRREHMNFSPADLLDDVQFELIGLRSARTYGMRAQGLQAAINSTQAFIAANPTRVSQLDMMHAVFEELVGAEDADRFISVPTPLEKLYSQQEENEGLLQGAEIEVDDEDNHEEHLKDIDPLYRRAIAKNTDMPHDVRKVVILHREIHRQKLAQQKATEQARQDRMPQAAAAMTNPELGGALTDQPKKSAPPPGGMSDAMANQGGQEGQMAGENPGPPDSRKFSRTGGSGRNQSQTTSRIA